jgi:glycine/D-amino acid oxidase-like deaminating enzyme
MGAAVSTTERGDDGRWCLWNVTAPAAPATDSLLGSIDADVVVIGGGFTGLSTALHLALGGARVVVLEAREIGYGGSGRNVGLVNAGLWVKPSVVLDALGQERGHRLLTLLGGAPQLVYDLVQRHDIRCEALHNGTLHCAPNRRGELDLEARHAQWRELGAPVTLLDGEETVRRTGTTLYRRGLLDARAGTIQPLAYARGLARAAMAAGAQVFTRSAALERQQHGKAWRVVTANGSVTADWVVVATGAYTQSLQAELRAQQIHLRYFNVATEPLPEDVRAEVLPGRHGLWDTCKVLRSMRRDADNRLVVGSIGSLDRGHAAIHRAWAARLVKRTFPRLGQVRFAYAWDGIIDMTADSLPRFHKPGTNVICATGYNGRGIAPGTVFGREIAGHILGQTQEADLPLAISAVQPARRRMLDEAIYRLGSSAVHSVT